MSRITEVPTDDPEMLQASREARRTFRFFWRELFWEYRRIIPAMTLSAFKMAFNDPPEPGQDPVMRDGEQMWVNEVYFDGKTVSGKLLNEPRSLNSVRQGDLVRTPPEKITDWMYVYGDRAYGAFTVNLIRSRMPRQERASHDNAWGLNFGDPHNIEIFPRDWFSPKPAGFLGRLFGKQQALPPNAEELEHPMALNMAPEYEKQLQTNPEVAQDKDTAGWTNLHQFALAGSPACVGVLLKYGADPNAKTNHGLTPLQLARSLNWTPVADLLLAHGAAQ